MRPVRVSMNAAGYSAWVPIDYVESWFGATVAVILSEDGNLTYTVQFTMDTYEAVQPLYKVSIARSGTTATVTDPGPLNLGHGLTTADSVLIKGSGSGVLDSPYATQGATTLIAGDLGWQVASTPSATTYTYTVANSGLTADTGSVQTGRLRVFPHATLAAQSTRQNGTFNYPVRAVRLYVSAYSAGYVDMLVLQGNAR